MSQIFSPYSDQKINEDIQKISDYAPKGHYCGIDHFMIDEKEKRIIRNMLEIGYFLVGQLNADGSFDQYAQTYIDNEAKKILHIPKHEDKEEQVKAGLRTRARNQKNHDGNAFVFAKIPGRAVTDITKRVKNRKADIFKIGTIVPGTEDVITEVGKRVVYDEGEVLEVRLNYSSRWIYVDVETCERVVTESGIPGIIRDGNYIPGTDDIITKVGTFGDIKQGVRMVELNDQKGWVPLNSKTGERVIEKEMPAQKKEIVLTGQISIMDELIGSPNRGAHKKAQENVGMGISTMSQRNILSAVMDDAAKGMEGQGDGEKIMSIFSKKGKS